MMQGLEDRSEQILFEHYHDLDEPGKYICMICGQDVHDPEGNDARLRHYFDEH